jgi:nicotinate phosphoribosyltransferase
MTPDSSTSPDTNSGLLTDYYQLTMMQGYLKNGLTGTAVFEFFFRKLPKQRGFLVAMGLESLLECIERLHFTADELQWLREKGCSAELLAFLCDFRFTGDVHAVPEGSIVFPEEPILRITAPLPQAQLLETRAINLLHFQTLIASKAVRNVLSAPDKPLVEFGLRRAHGAEAGLLAARACYLAGFAGTSNVMAGRMFDIPIFGTMAHAFVLAHDDEIAAFADFARANPNDAVLILDTYDTQAAAAKVVKLAQTLAGEGIRIRGVRLDSGDLAEHARKTRRILDDGGLRDVQIFASGNLDEWSLAKLTAAKAPIDGYGIGTRLDVSADVPYLDCAYKLQEYAGKPRRKRSEAKATWPGPKQVYRVFGPDGLASHDELTLDEGAESSQPASASSGQPQALIVPVMRAGRRVGRTPASQEIRACLADQLAQLRPELKALEPQTEYRVEIMPALHALAAQCDGLRE